MGKNAIAAVRGMKDMMGAEAMRFRHLINALGDLAQTYGCAEIATPIVEPLEVFSRSLGETSDVVSKEMYTLQDRKGSQLVLRPEGTAGICRAIANSNPAMPVRYWYQGAMFRYERPQKGRQRQFHQLGVEFFGEDSFLADVEGIQLAVDFLSKIAIDDFTLNINSLGDAVSRQSYQKALVDYLQEHQENLSADSQARLEKNPLRILDSKDANDQKLLKNAPVLQDYFNEDSQRYFDKLVEALNALNIKYVLNSSLVRGLDYYNHTVFECISNNLGAQGTILAGGRYDGLVQQMGGNATPGFGWAAGLERLELLLPEQPQSTALCVVLLLNDASIHSLKCLTSIRKKQPAIMLQGNNLGKLIKKANAQNATHIAIIGDKEAAENGYILKDLNSGAQQFIHCE